MAALSQFFPNQALPDYVEAASLNRIRNFRLIASFFGGLAIPTGLLALYGWRIRRGHPKLAMVPDAVYCGECGYDLRNLPAESECPECGLPVGFWQKHERWSDRLRRDVSRLGPHEYARRFGIPENTSRSGTQPTH